MTFAAAERLALIAAGAQLASRGLSPGTSGNVSVMAGDVVLMSPSGTSLAELEAGSLSVLDPATGELLGGARPSKEVPLHLALYARDPAATAVVHVHSPHAAAASCLTPWSEHCCLPPLTPYLLMKVGQVPLIPYAPPGDAEQAAWLRAVPFPFRGALLANHGSIVAMGSLEDAVAGAIEIEEAARTALLVQGQAHRLLTAAQIDVLVARWGAPWTPSGDSDLPAPTPALHPGR